MIRNKEEVEDPSTKGGGIPTSIKATRGWSNNNNQQGN
jgi:hypothetical protein